MKRKVFKKVICLLLTLSFLVALSSQLAIGALAYEPHDHTVSGSQIGNEFLKIWLDGSHSIDFHTVEGDPSTTRDNNKRLLYNGTSGTYINVNGSVVAFSASGTKLSSDGRSMYSWCTINGIKIDRIISYNYNTYTGRYDIAEFKYIMTNTTDSTKSVGARIMFDTMLGDNDQAPFKVNGNSITNRTEFVGDAVPQVWHVFDDLTNPTVVASGKFYNNISERPDKVQFNNWGVSSNDVWDPGVQQTSIGDSAVNIFYNPTNLAPGESRTVRTFYGLSELNIHVHVDENKDYVCDECGEILNLNYSFNYGAIAPHELVANANNDAYEGNPFSFSGWIQNDGNMPLQNVTATLTLPAGLSVQGNTQVTFDTIAVGGTESLFWGIQAASCYSETVLEYSLTVTANGVNSSTTNYTITLPALNVPCQHNVGYNWVIDEAPTCLEYGSGHYECAGCGEFMYSDHAAPLGHDYKVVRTEEATCTEDGCIYFECDRDGCDATKEQIIPARGHDFDANFVCRTCGFVLPQHRHDYTATTVAPTCTTMGYTEFVCDCGYSYRADYIEMLGHRWDEGVVTTEKTCTTPGVKQHSCERDGCDAVYDEVIPASHNWSETVTVEATCTVDGLLTRTCLDCGAVVTEVIPASHKWDEGVVDLEPTCTEDGNKVCQCQVCHLVADIPIDRLGHTYYNGVCTRCGDRFIYNVTQGDHPEYGMYFEIEDIISNYGPDIINEYGLLLDYNEGARFDKVAIYLTQEGNLWRRCIACTGENIEYATYVPYLSYGDDIKYTGLNSDWINIFRLSENADGIWCYSNYATIGVNLEDNQGNLLLSLYDIGQAGTQTRIFDDLAEMIEWLSDGNDGGNECDHIAGRWVVVTEPTYTTEGLRVKRCVECNAILESEVLPMLNSASAKVETEASFAVVDKDIVFTLTIENCDLVEALAILPQFDSDYFELVSAEWSIEAPLQDIDDITNRAISAFDTDTDVNTVVYTFVLRAKTPIASTSVGCNLQAQIDGVVTDIYVRCADVKIILCDHPTVEFTMIDGQYHNGVCTVCGHEEASEHRYDGVCDSECNDCGYVRVAPHAYSDYYAGDETGHWHVCTLCGAIDEVVAHVYDNHSDCECNDCGYVRFIRGDVDDDGDVDADDSVYLVYHIFFGDIDYPVCQNLDFNGDGSETSDDGVYLLYYVFFGAELYPLH